LGSTYDWKPSASAEFNINFTFDLLVITNANIGLRGVT